MDVHPAVAGFDKGALDYERGRPQYPEAAVAWLTEMLRIGPGSTVVDLAAGTGKLTRQLLTTGARLVAVEPVAGMRAVLQAAVPQVEVLEGTAEHLPLPASSVDAVTVGQAFHWFRGEVALAEIHRALRPRGRLGLVWNRRDLSQPLQVELHDLFEHYRGSTPSVHTEQWKAAFASTELFGPLSVAHFPMEQVLGGEHLVARVLSVSFMAQLPGNEQAEVARLVLGLARAQGGRVALHYLTDTYWCEHL